MLKQLIMLQFKMPKILNKLMELKEVFSLLHNIYIQLQIH